MAVRTLCCLLFLLSLEAYLPCTVTQSTSQRLLVILLDGFRFDYLNQSSVPLPGFDKLARMGVKVGGLVPEFPSLSFPNYYSLMTGLHTESHGMTGNYMYDVTRQEAFLLGANPEHFHAHWWNHAEPVWIAAKRLNKKSHMFFWRGCEVEIRGQRPTFCHVYTGVPSLDDFRSALDRSLSLLRSGQTDLAAVYFELVDKYGHNYGPFSANVNAVLRDLDPIVSDLVDQLSDPGMSEVNLMVFSDHGMTKVTNTIDLSAVLDRSDYLNIKDGPSLASIYTVPGREQQVFNKLVNFHPNMTVYRKSDLPDRWHYKHGPYVSSVTAVADLGWEMFTPAMKEHNTSVYAGMHGYDNAYTDMMGIFLAMGPAFKKGQTVDRLRTVDLYQIMCQILRIPPSPNNGSRSDVTLLLADVSGTSPLTPATFGVMVYFVMCLVYMTG